MQDSWEGDYTNTMNFVQWDYPSCWSEREKKWDNLELAECDQTKRPLYKILGMKSETTK